MSELVLDAGEAAERFSAQDTAPEELHDRPGRRRPMLHLLLGNSVAQRAAVASRFRSDDFLNRAKGGETWSHPFGSHSRRPNGHEWSRCDDVERWFQVMCLLRCGGHGVAGRFGPTRFAPGGSVL